MAQRPGHVLVHAVVLGVEYVAGRAPRVVREACSSGAWGGLSPVRWPISGPPAPRHAEHSDLSSRPQAHRLPLGAPAPAASQDQDGGTGDPLTVNAQHPLAFVFRAGLKLFDDVLAAFQGHARHLVREGHSQASPSPAGPRPPGH